MNPTYVRACVLLLVLGRSATAAPSSTHAWAVLCDASTKAIADSLTARLGSHPGQSAVAIVTDGVPPGFDHYVVVLPSTRTAWPDRYTIYNVHSVAPTTVPSHLLDRLRSATHILDCSTSSLAALMRASGADAAKATFLPLGDVVGVGHPDDHPMKKQWDVVVLNGDAASCKLRAAYAALATRLPNVRATTASTHRDAMALLPQTQSMLIVPCSTDAVTHVALVHAALAHGVRVATVRTRAMVNDYPHTLAKVHALPHKPSVHTVHRLRDWVGGTNANNATSTSETRAALSSRLDYMVARFLIGAGYVTPDADATLPSVLDASIRTHALPTFVLSVPELPRRATFVQRYGADFDYVLYDGYTFKKTPFMGAGLSYQRLARLALARGWDTILVMEDDVVLPPRFGDALADVLAVADADPAWDLLSGMISDVHNDTRVLKVHVQNGHMLATVDRMTGMVFNVYRQPALRVMASWNASNDDFDTNTIDRYMQAAGLRTLVRVPYLVSHDSGTASSIWGNQLNSHYDAIIADSAAKLNRKITAEVDRAAGNDVRRRQGAGQSVSQERRQWSKRR